MLTTLSALCPNPRVSVTATKNPTGPAARRARYSMPFFLHFRPDFVIEPLEGCREGGVVEPTVTADEYLQERLREIKLT